MLSSTENSKLQPNGHPVHAMLLKEAETKRAHQKSQEVHKVLLAEGVDRVESKPMARQSGAHSLKNSGWNTDWDFIDPTKDIEAAKRQVYQKAARYFQSLQSEAQQGTVADIAPGPLTFRFSYYRTIIPDNDKGSNQKATTALDTLDQYLPGFKQFAADLERSNIPLSPYFMTENPNNELGRVSPEQMKEFVGEQHGQNLTMPDGRRIPNASHYAPHLQKERVQISGPRNSDRYYPLSAADQITDPALLVKAIEYRTQIGYSLSRPKLQQAIMAMYQQKLEQYNLSWQTTDERQQKEVQEIASILKTDFLDRILGWWDQGRATDIPAFLLREVLKNMDYIGGGTPSVPPDQFVIPDQRSMYYSNGWDSSPGDPNETMLVVPPLKGLPPTSKGLGEVRYDRGNGNMSYDHLTLNWKGGLDGIFQKYGAKADEWLATLQNGNMSEEVNQASPEVFAAWQLILSSNSGSRTGAENLLDTIARWPDWGSFYRNHLQKSMYSEISTVNSLSRRQFTKGSFNMDSPLQDQVQYQVEQIKQIANEDPVAATNMLLDASAELVSLYQQGFAKPKGMVFLSWDHVTQALNALNQASRGNPSMQSNGMKTLTRSEEKKMIDETGFQQLKQWGYQIAKMMDFLRAVMGRCCHEEITTHKEGFQEQQYGHRYGTSSGVSQGGNVILSITYNRLSAQMQGDQVNIDEDVTFQLGQKTGDREPIVSRQSTSWERMLDLFGTMYPEAGYQFEEINEPVERGYKLLERKIKEAITEANVAGFKVVYNSTEGNSFPLTKEDVAIENEVTEQAAPVIEPEPETTMDETPLTWSEGWEPPDASYIEDQIVQPQEELTPTIPDDQKSMVKSKPTPDEPLSFLPKRNKKDRRLFRQNPGRGRLPVQLGSIEERFIKAANRLDEHGEQAVADKIDDLLEKLSEVNNVRKKSRL